MITLGTACSAAHPHASDPPFAINVTSSPYNAACDGTTDDTTAIQSALNAAAANGSRVEIPSTGHPCKITSTLTVPQNVVLEGETPYASYLQFASTGNGPAVLIGSTTASSPLDQHGGGLQNLGVYGDSSTGALPSQIGVEVANAIEANLFNVRVANTGTGFYFDGGGSGSWTGDLGIVDPMTSNVVNGMYFTQSGGVITDIRCCSGGYIYGYSHTQGYGLYATGMHSSQFFGLSIQHFNYGVYLDTGTNSTQFFGARVEATGPENGTQSFVCNASGTTAEFWGPHDSDVTTTAITNTNSATCALTNS